MSYSAEFLRDVRYAIRILLKTPVPTAIAILALALGIGVNVSSFIPISSLLLHPFPYPDLDRVVTVWETLPKQHVLDTLAPANYLDLKGQADSYEKLAVYRNTGADLTGGDITERVRGAAVSLDFFPIFKAHAAMGRVFTADDTLHGNSRVVVVSYSFWKSHLASAPDAVGKSISILGSDHKVIGVMPDEFDFPLSSDIWVPLSLDAKRQERGAHDLAVLGLLKAGIAPAQASAEAGTIASHLASRYPATNEGRAMQVLSLRDYFLNEGKITSRFVLVLLFAASFVLLLACANIGNLQLSKAANRRKEIAVRAALGATGPQIARQLLAESFVIALCAGALGLVLATWNNDLTKHIIPPNAMRHVPGLRTMGIDSTVVLLTLAVSLIAGLICSVPSIVQLVRPMRFDLTEALRERSSGGNSSTSRKSIHSALIVFEVALALMLLIGAGLMVRTFESLLTRYQGFDPKNLLTMQVALPASRYQSPAQIGTAYDGIFDKLSETPGIAAAGLASGLGTAAHFQIEGRPDPRPGEPRPELFSVGGRYFEAMKIPVLEGRSIGRQDRADSPAVVMISKTVAQHYWPAASPIGHRISVVTNGQARWLTIVGVCGDVVENWFAGDPAPSAYVPYGQTPSAWAEFDVRTTGDPAGAAPAVRAAFRAFDKTLSVYDVKTMEESNFEERSGVFAAARSMSMYALVALLLASTGIYAVVAYFVAARTHDIGVHIALGASRGDVLKMTMGQTARLIGLGLAIGFVSALLLGRVMSSALFGVVNLQPSTFAVFTALLVVSALFASYLPARRAMQIDPMVALREE
jgi:putative ABC transport system permease protein